MSLLTRSFHAAAILISAGADVGLTNAAGLQHLLWLDVGFSSTTLGGLNTLKKSKKQQTIFFWGAHPCSLNPIHCFLGTIRVFPAYSSRANRLRDRFGVGRTGNFQLEWGAKRVPPKTVDLGKPTSFWNRSSARPNGHGCGRIGVGTGFYLSRSERLPGSMRYSRTRFRC